MCSLSCLSSVLPKNFCSCFRSCFNLRHYSLNAYDSLSLTMRWVWRREFVAFFLNYGHLCNLKCTLYLEVWWPVHWPSFSWHHTLLYFTNRMLLKQALAQTLTHNINTYNYILNNFFLIFRTSINPSSSFYSPL